MEERMPTPKKDPRSDPERWLDEHGNYLFGYAVTRLRDRALAEDMVQETLLAAIQGRDRFEGRSSERTWLVGILKHKILDHIRRKNREIPVTEVVGPDESIDVLFDERGKWKYGPSAWADDPELSVTEKEFWTAFIRCLEKLPGHLGQVFALRELEGFERSEIRNLLGLTSTNLGVILHRARMRLRRCLEVNWFGEEDSGRE
jgi:RNA polymerase sigma-70 factor (ECF subfamily)